MPADPWRIRELPAPAGTRLWLIRLRAVPQALEELRQILAPSERARASRVPEVAARRFIVRRAVLRQVLGTLTGSDPRRLRLSTAPGGKPVLRVPSVGLHFNQSHVRDWALLAVAAQGEVGVDLAWSGGTAPFDQVVRRYFSPAEQAELASLASGQRRHRFCRIWTRKEAWLKGLGTGLSAPLRATRLGGPARPVDRPRRVPGGSWVVHDLRGLPRGLVGSLARDGAPRADGTGLAEESLDGPAGTWPGGLRGPS